MYYADKLFVTYFPVLGWGGVYQKQYNNDYEFTCYDNVVRFNHEVGRINLHLTLVYSAVTECCIRNLQPPIIRISEK